MSSTSALDRALIKRMRANGILHDFDITKLEDPGHMVLVSCADGSRKLEMLLYHHHLAEGAGHVPVDACVFHDPSLNGGGLLLCPDSPLVSRDLRQDRVLLDSIEGGVKFKKMDKDGKRPLVVIYVHTSCAAADFLGLNVVEQMMWLVKGKQHLKTLHRHWRVLCALRVYQPEPELREADQAEYTTYTFSSKEFLSWSWLETVPTVD